MADQTSMCEQLRDCMHNYVIYKNYINEQFSEVAGIDMPPELEQFGDNPTQMFATVETHLEACDECGKLYGGFQMLEEMIGEAIQEGGFTKLIKKLEKE